MVHTYLEWFKGAYSVNMELLGGVMSIEDFKKSWEEELDNFKPSVDDEQYKFLDVGFCDCVFSKEEIERLVDLTKQPSYLMPSGLTREEKRMFILNSVKKEGER